MPAILPPRRTAPWKERAIWREASLTRPTRDHARRQVAESRQRPFAAGLQVDHRPWIVDPGEQPQAGRIVDRLALQAGQFRQPVADELAAWIEAFGL